MLIKRPVIILINSSLGGYEAEAPDGDKIATTMPDKETLAGGLTLTGNPP